MMTSPPGTFNLGLAVLIAWLCGCTSLGPTVEQARPDVDRPWTAEEQRVLDDLTVAWEQEGPVQVGGPSTVGSLACHRVYADDHVGVHEYAAGAERPVNAFIE